MSKNITTKTDDELARQLDNTAVAINQPEFCGTEQGLRRYVQDEAWLIEKAHKAADDYERGRGQTMPFEDYMADLRARVEATL